MSHPNELRPPLPPLEQGDPADDERAFRRCLGQFATGVTIVTAKAGEQLVGMAVNSFAAVSLDPPLVLWSIRRESASCQAFLDAGHFAVSILAADQVDVCHMFGSAQPDRFEKTPWSPDIHDAPLLHGAIGHFSCELEAVHEGGDHLTLVGRVKRYVRFPGEPLLFVQGQYAVARNHPCLEVQSLTPSGSIGKRTESAFMTLLAATSQRMSLLFQEHRRAVGLTVPAARILNRLFEEECNRKALEDDTYLGRHSVEDALTELIAEGLVQAVGQGVFRLTPRGLEKRKELAERAASFEAAKLQGISEADIASTKKVLLKLYEER